VEPIRVALCVAIALAAVAAFFDWRTAEIPNWLTLPPLGLSPFLYGQFFGFEAALRCFAATLLSALVPYFLFRRAAMGGGDVKLLGALGAVTSFDLLAGLEIQLSAFVIALAVAFAALAWEGRLASWLWAAAVRPMRALVPWLGAAARSVDHRTSIRMGGPIFIATSIFVASRLASASTWRGL
jgi:prepilin peptidase CpaA